MNNRSVHGQRLPGQLYSNFMIAYYHFGNQQSEYETCAVFWKAEI